jgi:hypothetical protein
MMLTKLDIAEAFGEEIINRRQQQMLWLLYGFSFNPPQPRTPERVADILTEVGGTRVHASQVTSWCALAEAKIHAWRKFQKETGART